MATRKDVLIGEDDAVLREVYVKKFKLSGYTIRVAANGEEVLREVKEQPPAVLVLDIHMPVMDGFGVLENLPRADRNFPIIMLTNFGDENSRRRGKELGADDFFIKSEMTIKTLLQMVEDLLQKEEPVA